MLFFGRLHGVMTVVNLLFKSFITTKLCITRFVVHESFITIVLRFFFENSRLGNYSFRLIYFNKISCNFKLNFSSFFPGFALLQMLSNAMVTRGYYGFKFFERRRKKLFIQQQIEHPFSLGNINIISDKNALYEREIVLVLLQIWLPQLVVFFLVNRTFLWLFLAVFRGGHDSPLGQGSACKVFHR